MTKDRDILGGTDAEAEFFGETDSDAIDQELVALAHGPNPLFPVILVLLGAFAGFLIQQYWHDALYTFQDNEPDVLGDVLNWDTVDEEGQLVVPGNRFVKLRGVTQRRAVIGDLGYAKLSGVPVFAEVDPSVLNERSDSARTYGQMLEFGGERYVVTKPGRLVAFEDLPVRYQTIARYLSHAFEMQICGVDLEPELERALRAERERRVLALSETLGHTPSRQEIVEALGPSCDAAWLFQESLEPKDHRGFTIAWVVAWAVLVGAVAFLVVWIRRYRAFHDSDQAV